MSEQKIKKVSYPASKIVSRVDEAVYISLDTRTPKQKKEGWEDDYWYEAPVLFSFYVSDSHPCCGVTIFSEFGWDGRQGVDVLNNRITPQTANRIAALVDEQMDRGQLTTMEFITPKNSTTRQFGCIMDALVRKFKWKKGANWVNCNTGNDIQQIYKVRV